MIICLLSKYFRNFFSLAYLFRPNAIGFPIESHAHISVVGVDVSRVSILLGIGTGIIAAFMISARLPKIKNALARRLPESWQTKYLPMLRRVRSAVTGWLKAQGKLAAVTWALVSLGFLLLQIPYGPLWALLVALVDAVPLLGTGTVLLPWALVEMLQGNYFMAIGLTVLYAATAVTRAVLEPRLVGRQLGLDPLVTLLALYTGYQLWGILGMVAAPMLATVAKTVAELPPAEET